MSTPRRSLSCRVPWSRVAGELDIHVRTLGLPAATRCPFCEGVMRVYRDPLLETEWFCCPSCHRQGDMIELAAGVWELDVAKTISRLRRLGFGLPDSADDIDAYVQQHVEYRGRLQGLWNTARVRLDKSRALFRLSHQLGMDCEVSDERRVAGPAAILRGSNTMAVERCFAPGSMEHADARPQRNNPSERAVFRGGGWGEVLLVPYYDLPWRICGFALMGRNGDPKQDVRYKRANLGSLRVPSYEAGLAMHPQVLEVSEQWDDTIIAIGDLITAWRLQMRHMERNLGTLPLVVWHDSRDYRRWHAGNRIVRTHDAWGMLGSRKIVFWMPVPTVGTFEQAIHTGGKISTVGPRGSDADSLKEFCWKYTPEDLAKYVQAHALPWPEVLSDHLDGLTGPAVEDLLAQLELAGVDLDTVIPKLATGTRLRLARIRSAGEMVQSVDFEGVHVIERDHEWHRINRNGLDERIANTVLRIDAWIWAPSTEQTYCAGRVFHEDMVVEFCELEETIEKDCYRWLNQLLMTKILRRLVGSPSWFKRLVRLACKFQQPEILRGVDQVGYDREGRRFVFPKFRIDEGGKVSTRAYPIFPDPVPAGGLEPPEVVSPEELNRPAQRCDQGAAEVFWGVTACMLANVVAPAFHLQTQGIALLGHVASDVGQTIARTLGCVEYVPRMAAGVKKAVAAEHRHGWPVLLGVTSMIPRRQRRLLLGPREDGRSHNCIAAVEFVAAKLLAIGGGWCTITTEHEGGIEAETLAVAKILIPSYLKDLSERKFDLGEYPKTSAHLMRLIVQDLARYVKAHYGDEEDVLSAGRAITVDDEQSRAEALVDLLGYFEDRWKLEIRPMGEERRKHALLEVDDDDGQRGLILPYATLDKLTAQSSAPLPSIDNLYRVLDEVEVLLDEHDDGPVVRREWFDQRRRVSRVKRTGQMKVFG